MTGEPLLSRRDVMRICGMGMLTSPLAVLAACGGQTKPTFSEPADAPYQGTDEQVLDEIQRAIFNFFWNEASPNTVEDKEPALSNGNYSLTMSSMPATGIGLTI